MKEYIVGLLLVLEILTPLTTQAIKVNLDGLKVKYNSTLIALICAIVLSGLASAFVMITNSIEINLVNVCYVIALVIFNWIGSTVGYDKIKAIFSSK